MRFMEAAARKPERGRVRDEPRKAAVIACQGRGRACRIPPDCRADHETLVEGSIAYSCLFRRGRRVDR